MRTILFIKRTICAVPFIVVISFVLVPAQAADQQPAIGVPGPAVIIEPDTAAGAVEDTIQACMARIPKDASIGQRIIAEQGCWRDESDRKPFQSVPEARSVRR